MTAARSARKKPRLKRMGSPKKRGSSAVVCDSRGDGPEARRLHRPVQQPVAQPECDPVHHDGVDHFMRAGCRLEIAGDGAPDRAGHEPAEDRQRQVDDQRQALEGIPDKGGAERPHEVLAFGADVEEAGLEAQRDCQAREDVGRGRDEAFGERPEGLPQRPGLAGFKERARVRPRSATGCRTRR